MTLILLALALARAGGSPSRLRTSKARSTFFRRRATSTCWRAGRQYITVQAGSDGVFLVDTMSAPLADKILAAIRTISKGPIRYIVDTQRARRSCRRK